MYNYLVIGAGLMGSAAARHLAEQADGVAIIGPAEPVAWATHDGVFSSHYDQGRLASANGPDEIWNQLDQDSIANYQPLEAASGVHFYEPAGLITMVPVGQPEYAYKNEIPGVKRYAGGELPADLPLRAPAGLDVYVEGAPSGYINPRDMVRAQLQAAINAGATVIRQEVHSLKPGDGYLEIITNSGERLQARKVLLATGAFANCFDLLPRRLALRVKPESTILAEVTAAEAERLAHVPPMSIRYANREINDPYLVPPVLYPDGRYYLKMGCDTRSDVLFTSLEQMRDWFWRGNTDAHKIAMQTFLRDLFPGLEVLGWQTKPCIVCYTPSGKPFVDAYDDRIFVLTGGNGTGAHPSDALGKLAADLMVTGNWNSSLDRDPFRLQFADDWGEWLEAPLKDHFGDGSRKD
ncbi:MAG: FAD-binding oxidoreductase [Ardenticatenales bacterium]|nr:FAD-binding oxidoreductase [Ardenticatenales bacterium]